MENIKKGRIINIVSNIFYVEIENEVVQCTSRGIFKEKKEKPVVGDIVKVDINEKSILEILDRKNYIKRPKSANISKLILVVSCKKPKPDLLMLDKQLAFAEFLNIEPIIIINKIDLDLEKAKEIEEIYSKIGYKVIKTNAKELDINSKEIYNELKDNISAFSGNSGVGKSTLINGIFKDFITEEGEVSHKNKRGKNTTTSIKLYKVDDNTYIADTPGFSTFDIYEINYKEFYKYFKEFNKFIIKCEYQDCTHIKEENCGIKENVGKSIPISRYENYIKIYNELKDKEEHKW